MKTFITVFIAVILANATTLAFYEYYQQRKENNYIDMNAMETVTIPETADTKPAAKSKVMASEEQRLKELQESAENLCRYWTKAYDKDPTGLNEALKEKACMRAKKLKPAESSEARPSEE